MEKTEQAPPLSWAMFDIVCTLGEGAFGNVYKVKCLMSTCVNEGRPYERIMMNSTQVKKAKKEMITGGSVGQQGLYHPDKLKTLIKDQHYVVKVIDVAKVPEDVGLDALREIDLMQTMDSPFVVGYFDSFIDEQKINIILYYCSSGDLFQLITKQQQMNKAFNENVIWKIFINICLGMWYMHTNGIIHRDIKALNIFMAKADFAKIGDLGCAIPEDELLDKPK